MRKTLALIAAVGLFVAACGGSAASTAPAASVAASVEASESVGPAESAVAGARTVDVEIAAGKITPANIDVTKGETITFNVKNVSDTEVELIVGLAPDVASDSGDSLKEAEQIAAGASKTVSYTFDAAGPYAYGDQVGDHYAKGAKGTITIKP